MKNGSFADISNRCITCDHGLMQVHGDRPQVGRRTISDRNFTWLMMATNFSGDFYFEIMHDGGNVNAQRNLQFLQCAL